jgi:antitoxin PrlF
VQKTRTSIFGAEVFIIPTSSINIVRMLFDKGGRNLYYSCMKTTVSEKGQVTIPKPLRHRLGIRTGQVLEVKEERGRLVVTKLEATDPVAEVFGILNLGGSTDSVLRALRGDRSTK